MVIETPSILRTLLIMCGTTVLLPMIGLCSYPGYHFWSLGYGIKTSESAASAMWGDGSYKLKNSEVGMTVAVKVKVVRRSCFVMGLLGSARHLSGRKVNSWERDERELRLTRCDVSSLVVDKLCDQARGQNTAVTCFYFDFASRKEHSATSMLGSLLKQIVGGLEKVPEEISRAFEEQKKAVGGRGLLLSDIVGMLRAVTSSLRTFVCIDALDECAAVHRVKVLDSLKQILEKSQSTRIFIIGRPHIRAEVERRLAGRVMSVSVGSSKDDITEYIRLKLDEDETPEAMDETLEADILERIPEKMSEMCVGHHAGSPTPHHPLIDMYLGFY